jgi:hypothetical protein
VGEAARGEQLIANQGQDWMGIRTMSKRSRISKKVKRGVESYKGGKLGQERDARGWVDKESLLFIPITVHMCVVTCYLRITLLCD